MLDRTDIVEVAARHADTMELCAQERASHLVTST